MIGCLAPTPPMSSAAPFDPALNAAVLHIVGRLCPTGFDVVDDSPDTIEVLRERLRRTGRIAVWGGASENTIYGCREVNLAFRAWHDWCHLRGVFPFDIVGEIRAVRMQMEHVHALYGRNARTEGWERLLWAEVVGQSRYLARWGMFPIRQREFTYAFLVDPLATLDDPSHATPFPATITVSSKAACGG